MADTAFLRVHAWFDQAITEALKDVADPTQKAALRKILWSLTDPTNPAIAPPPAEPAQFAKASVSGKSLSVGAVVEHRFNYARTADGRAGLWVARKKRVVRGETFSALLYSFNIAVQSGPY